MSTHAKELHEQEIREHPAFRPEPYQSSNHDQRHQDEDVLLTPDSHASRQTYLIRPSSTKGEYVIKVKGIDMDYHDYFYTRTIKPTSNGFEIVFGSMGLQVLGNLRDLITQGLGVTLGDMQINDITLDSHFRRVDSYEGIFEELRASSKRTYIITVFSSDPNYYVINFINNAGDQCNFHLGVGGGGYYNASVEYPGGPRRFPSIKALLKSEGCDITPLETKAETKEEKEAREKRNREKVKENIEKVRKNWLFKDITLEQAHEILDNKFDEDTLYIPGEKPDIFIFLFRKPPLTFSKTFQVDENWDEWENFAEMNRFYKECVNFVNMKKAAFEFEQKRINEREVALNRESSMAQLSGNQVGILAAVKNKYTEKMKKMGGVEAVIKDFKKYLTKKFTDNPPKLKDKKLPLEFDERTDSKESRELYYLNRFHTAWRYFLTPNPWRDYDATLTPEMLEDLAYLWLAASDSTITPIREMTLETMKEQFAEEIAYLARAHNWDHLDSLSKEEKKKVVAEMMKKYGKPVDNLGPDQSSCPGGANQRLMQSINGNPITDTPDSRPLDPAIARNKLGELIATRFNEYLADKDRKQIQEILDAFDRCYVSMEASDKDKKLLAEFKLTAKDINHIVKEMQTMYGDRFTWLEMQTDADKYPNYEAYIRSMARKNIWEQAFSERLLGIAQGRIQALTPIPIKEHLAKALKSRRAALTGGEEEEIKEREVKEKHPPKPPFKGGEDGSEKLKEFKKEKEGKERKEEKVKEFAGLRGLLNDWTRKVDAEIKAQVSTRPHRPTRPFGDGSRRH